MYDYRYAVGDISAATLGYISGGRKGAQVARNLYKLSQNKMAPVPRTHRKNPNSMKGLIRSAKRLRTNTFTSRPIARILPKSLSIRKRPRSSVKHKQFSSGVNSRRAEKFKRRVRGVDYKRPKKVKVSRKLRHKINKVISGRSYPGYYQSTFYGSASAPTLNQQAIFQTNADGLTENLFSPRQILNAASILWNGKIPSATSPLITDALNFDPKQAKIHVNKCWMSMQIRNDSQRTIYLKMFDCKPLQMQSAAYAYQTWLQGLAEMAASGAGGVFSENPTAVNPGTLHADPKSINNFRKFYKAEVTKFVIEPGQAVDYTIRGPSDIDYDYSKFYLGSTFQEITKLQRQCFGVLYNDVLNTNTGMTGRAPETAIGPGLAWEINAYYSLSIPEKAGWVNTSATLPPPVGGVQEQERHNAYAIYTQPISYTGTVLRVDEENPAQTTAI